MEVFIVLLVVFIAGIAWIIEQIQRAMGSKNRKKRYYSHHSSYNPQSNNQSQKLLPNGYTKQEYYKYGYSDFDIEYWGLDQPSAPSPETSGFIIADMMDGDFDGDIDFPF